MGGMPSMPGMGGMPSMPGMAARSNVTIQEIDPTASSSSSRTSSKQGAAKQVAPNTIPARDWSLDNVSLIDPRHVTDTLFALLVAGLGDPAVSRSGRTVVRVRPLVKPELTVQVRVKFTTIELSLVQNDT